MAKAGTRLYHLLRVPWIYELVQTIFGADDDRTRFVNNYVLAKPGDRVLDIGCGPGEIVRYLPDVEYVGYSDSCQSRPLLTAPPQI